MPPHALDFPFESVKEEGEYWCDVSVRYAAPVSIHMKLAEKIAEFNSHLVVLVSSPQVRLPQLKYKLV